MLLNLLQGLAAAPIAAAAGAPAQYVLDLASVFTLFLIMLGPLKLLGPYAQSTAGLAFEDGRRLAMKVTALATVSAVLGGLLGAGMLEKWHVTAGVLEIAAGLIFLLVALQSVMQQYAPAAGAPQHAAAPPTAASLVFPMVLTPYGIAALILLLSLSTDITRTLWIVAIMVGVMLLNLLAMIYVRAILPRFGLFLRILGAILGVLQVALALQIMVVGMSGLGIVGAGG